MRESAAAGRCRRASLAKVGLSFERGACLETRDGREALLEIAPSGRCGFCVDETMFLEGQRQKVKPGPARVFTRAGQECPFAIRKPYF